MRSTLLAIFAVLAFIVSSSSADAQVWKKIKQQTKDKVDKRVEKAEENVVARTGQVVDSTVEKAGRGVDTVVSKAGTVMDTVLNKTERGVSNAAGGVANAFKGSDDEASKLAEDLADGRATLTAVRFEPGTDKLDASSGASIARLAKVLSALDGLYLLEGHVSPGADPAGEQALSERRAAALKARLVAEGVPVTRLFSMGFGGTRPPVATPGKTPPNAERVEIARMQ